MRESVTGHGSILTAEQPPRGATSLRRRVTVAVAERPCTSSTIYQKRIGTGGSFSASPEAADGKIYCSSEDGDVYVIKAGPEYEELAKNAIGEVLMATPAISDGLIIFRGLNHIYAISPQR